MIAPMIGVLNDVYLCPQIGATSLWQPSNVILSTPQTLELSMTMLDLIVVLFRPYILHIIWTQQAICGESSGIIDHGIIYDERLNFLCFQNFKRRLFCFFLLFEAHPYTFVLCTCSSYISLLCPSFSIHILLHKQKSVHGTGDQQRL